VFVSATSAHPGWLVAPSRPTAPRCALFKSAIGVPSHSRPALFTGDRAASGGGFTSTTRTFTGAEVGSHSTLTHREPFSTVVVHRQLRSVGRARPTRCTVGTGRGRAHSGRCQPDG